MPKGKVKWFDGKKGYGFIEKDDGSGDVFAHYQDIVGDYFYRLRTAGRTRRHVAMLAADARAAMEACEPLPTDDPDAPRIPRIERWKLALGLIETFSPLHNPDAGEIPRWIQDWMTAHEAGQDMTRVAL